MVVCNSQSIRLNTEPDASSWKRAVGVFDDSEGTVSSHIPIAELTLITGKLYLKDIDISPDGFDSIDKVISIAVEFSKFRTYNKDAAVDAGNLFWTVYKISFEVFETLAGYCNLSKNVAVIIALRVLELDLSTETRNLLRDGEVKVDKALFFGPGIVDILVEGSDLSLEDSNLC